MAGIHTDLWHWAAAVIAHHLCTGADRISFPSSSDTLPWTAPMSSQTDRLLSLLGRSLMTTTQLIAGIGEDQRSAKTPCEEMGAHRLVEHLVRRSAPVLRRRGRSCDGGHRRRADLSGR